MRLELEREVWHRSGLLAGADRAGFGSVYEATGPNGEAVVAKFVPKSPGADRELLIGDALRASPEKHVVPVLDHGEHDDSWVIIMPRASTSLKRYFEEQNQRIGLDEVVRILTHVAKGLSAIGEQIVHRDLKPANVLLLNGNWALADFGIARYAEATTAVETRKYAMTAAYASPEQCRLQHATSASDIYSFGVLAYQLVSGDLPFRGPGQADFVDQHLRVSPEPLTAGPSRLRTLIEECLLKEPEARPRPAAVVARLERAALKPSSPGLARLAEANQSQISKRAKEQADRQLEVDRVEREGRLFAAGEQLFASFWEPVAQAIEEEAPTATIRRDISASMIFVAELGEAKLGISVPSQCSWHGQFSAVGYASISIAKEPDRSGWSGRSHSLWYCDPFEEGLFEWYETAFMSGAFGGSHQSVEPFSRAPGQTPAFDRAIGTEQPAWPLEPLDRDDPSEFVDRWIGWFADSVNGTLRRPSSMPEKYQNRPIRS